MRLIDYLNDNDISPAEFAVSIGVSKEAVRRYIAGDRRPTRRVLEKIALATACEVTANDFFQMTPQQAA